MFFDEKKNQISTIISKRTPKGDKVSEAPMKNEVVKHEDGQVDGRHVAAQDIIAALHEKSPEKLMHALANFHDLHSTASKPDKE
jgi:hypothetical protein